MDIKEAFLYLNRLILDKYVSFDNVKSMEDELTRRFINITPVDVKEIVTLYLIVKNNILRL
jgi:hypothetical protein